VAPVKIRKAIKTIRILSRAPAAASVMRAGAEDRPALRSFDKAAVKSLKKLAKRCFDPLDARAELASIADAANVELTTLAGDDLRALWNALAIVRALADEIHAVRVEALQPRRVLSAAARR
jgi:hypothetical protein